MATIRLSHSRSRYSRLRLGITLALAALVLLAVPAQANSADRSTSPVYWFDEDGMPTADVAGESRLVRTDSKISLNLRTTGLEAGHTYTVWWVIFNNPEDCEAGDGIMVECGEEDLANENVVSTLAAAAGNVVGNSGRGNFGGSISVGDTRNLAGVGTVLDTQPLSNPRGAEVHLVVRDHGPLNPAFMPDQIQTFGGGCDHSDDGFPPPLVGEGVDGGDDGFACFDPQFSVHLAD